jgi:hypothetical protein
LNIGYDLGVLTSEVFTMMVIMALVTTFMTGPALDLINYVFKSKEVKIPEDSIESSKYNILISFGNYEKGKSLLRLANSLVKKQKDVSSITAMHLSVSDEMHGFNLEEYEKETFIPILEESKVLNQEINTIFKATVDIENDIAEVANQGEYDLLLVGLGKSIFEGTLLGKVLGFTTRIINPDRLLDKITGKEGLFANSIFDERTRQIIAKNKTPLGILVDNELHNTDKVLVPFFGTEDAFLMDYIQKFIFNNNSKINIVDVNHQIENNFLIKNAIKSLEKKHPDNITLVEENQILKPFLIKQDLMVVSLDSWKKLVDSQSVWLSNLPSVLIIKP